jgi:hypothetical protein
MIDLDELDEWVLVNNNGDAVVPYETWKALIALARAGSRLAEAVENIEAALHPAAFRNRTEAILLLQRLGKMTRDALAAFREAQGEVKP